MMIIIHDDHCKDDQRTTFLSRLECELASRRRRSELTRGRGLGFGLGGPHPGGVVMMMLMMMRMMMIMMMMMLIMLGLYLVWSGRVPARCRWCRTLPRVYTAGWPSDG